MSWTVQIFNTRTGTPQSSTFVPSAGTWDTRLTGRGQGQFTIPLAGSGLSSATVRDLATGNKYTIVLFWDSIVVYAGVISRPSYARGKQMLTVTTQELRVAYMNSRMLYTVFSYTVGGTVLTVTSKSLSGAARAVIDMALQPTGAGTDWNLPVDLPADGSGTYSATWKHEERLKWEDHLSQIEDAGCEINFRPYIDGSGNLRWATEVGTQISFGTVTTIDANDPATPLNDLQVVYDYTEQYSGILGFGKGGTGAPAYGYSPGSGAANFSVRDIWLSFPDLDGTRLQQAVQALGAKNSPVEQWSFGLVFYPGDPAFCAPGRLLDVTITGDAFLADDTHHMRVIGLRGDLMATEISVEVQRA